MTKPSILERLARKIEPKPTDSSVSSVARRIKPMAEIKSAANAMRRGGRALPTNGHVRTLDGEAKIFYSDGSLRHPAGKVNGRLTRKQRAKVKRGTGFGRSA